MKIRFGHAERVDGEQRLDQARQFLRQAPQRLQRWRKPLLLTLGSFLLTTITGLILVAIVWFVTWWPVQAQLRAWAEDVLPSAPAPPAAQVEDRLPLPVTQPLDASQDELVELQPEPAVLIPPASVAAGEAVVHVPLPRPSIVNLGFERIDARRPLAPEGQLIIDPLEVAQVPYKVPVRNGHWDLSVIWDEVGWLETTGAYPGDDLAMVFVAHVTLPYPGGPGPFLNLGQLKTGDTIRYQTDDEIYVYQVDRTSVVSPAEVKSLYRPDGERLLLLTCTTYNALERSYENRLLVEASLVSQEKTDRAQAEDPGS